VARELFLRPFKVVEELVRAGAALPDDSKAAEGSVKDATNLKAHDTRWVTERAGWFNDDCFVYPGKSFGQDGEKISYVPRSETDPAFGLRIGSFKGWHEGLRSPCRKSDYLIIAIGEKASNILLPLIGEGEGCILQLQGSQPGRSEKTASSSGKTLTTRVAASMVGRCALNDLATFAISELGVNDLAFAIMSV
jgi:uncharacterized protein (DUF927 family)